MHEEQTGPYEEYQAKVARLSAAARKRPLKKEEMERLQGYLACMRMLCDTPYILDRETRVSPKLKELEAILGDLMADGDHKVLVFSEWERMLELVREHAAARGLGHAWHTGKVPQPRRRAEIRRFKEDPECRLFLSTDSGSVGLNLQAADVVINLDLPWNPAKLEQRIARAWRKHQKRPVQVINLVSEHTIEHRMLGLLEQKRALAAGVVDGRGEREMALPSGRAAFLERLDALMAGDGGAPALASADPMERLRETVLAAAGDGVERMDVHDQAGRRTVLVVTRDRDHELQAALERRLQEQLPDDTRQIQVLDRDTLAAVERLVEAGVLQLTGDATPLYQAAPEEAPERVASRRLGEARERMARSRRPREMAQLLHQGGFTVEAVAPMAEAVEGALGALLHWQGHDADGAPGLAVVESALVATGLLAADTPAVVARLREAGGMAEGAEAGGLLDRGEQLLAQADGALDGAG
ncbi:MAG: C-terminal helicase domain-containing protein [Gammaproteobacteria bacterium]|nr:C-terminal helicase domain-containing protein [Gammaproteobacteria bacterium]